MIGTKTLIGFLALLTTVLGLYLLNSAWRLKQRSWPRLVLAWGVVVGALCCWGYTSGADKGVALGFVAFVAVALLFLANAAARSTPRPGRSVRERKVKPDATQDRMLVSRIWTGLLIGPVAGLSALALSTTAFVVLQAVGTEHTMNLTLVSFAFPVTWAALAVASGYQSRLRHKTATVLGTGLVSLAMLWIMV